MNSEILSRTIHVTLPLYPLPLFHPPPHPGPSSAFNLHPKQSAQPAINSHPPNSHQLSQRKEGGSPHIPMKEKLSVPAATQYPSVWTLHWSARWEAPVQPPLLKNVTRESVTAPADGFQHCVPEASVQPSVFRVMSVQVLGGGVR